MENPFKDGEGLAAIVRRLPGVDEDTVKDYIDDAWARATSIAPCIALETFPPGATPELQAIKVAELMAILRGVILRWHEAQSGAVTGKTQMAGPYQQSLQLDARPKRGYVLQPSEIIDFQRLCVRKGRPFSFDTMPDDDTANIPLYGVVVNGDTETLNGPPGEWSPDAPEVDV